MTTITFDCQGGKIIIPECMELDRDYLTIEICFKCWLKNAPRIWIQEKIKESREIRMKLCFDCRTHYLGIIDSIYYHNLPHS